MQLTIEKILERTQNTVKDEEFIEKHKRAKTDFVRKRNLSFAEITNFVIGNLGTSMDLEVLNFSSERSMGVSVAAVSKARDKINYSAFYELFRLSAEDIPVKYKYKDEYRITAFDGMIGELPNTLELRQISKTPKRNKYPQFHAISEYDVLNCCYTNAVFKFGSTDERQAVIELLENHSYEGKEIYLLDRGFPSLQLIQKLDTTGKNYVMRVSRNFLKEINDFGKSSAKDEIIQVKYAEQLGLPCAERIKSPNFLNVRCVKIELNKGETELLITNLDKAGFSYKDISELYNLRWKTETGFLNLKYAVCIEDFMGIKENSIQQEFYASLFKSNLYMQFIDVANDIIYNKKNYKTQLQSKHKKSG